MPWEVIYTVSSYVYFKQLGTYNFRPGSSVILYQELRKKKRKGIKDFINPCPKK